VTRWLQATRAERLAGAIAAVLLILLALAFWLL
jgi:hypothetical protein